MCHQQRGSSTAMAQWYLVTIKAHFPLFKQLTKYLFINSYGYLNIKIRQKVHRYPWSVNEELDALWGTFPGMILGEADVYCLLRQPFSFRIKLKQKNARIRWIASIWCVWRDIVSFSSSYSFGCQMFSQVSLKVIKVITTQDDFCNWFLCVWL